MKVMLNSVIIIDVMGYDSTSDTCKIFVQFFRNSARFFEILPNVQCLILNMTQSKIFETNILRVSPVKVKTVFYILICKLFLLIYHLSTYYCKWFYYIRPLL